MTRFNRLRKRFSGMKRTRKNITIRDVARIANVSTATVSHVINDTRYVGAETKERVLSVIRALNYKPNVLARSLKGKGTKTIGIIVANVRESFFANVVKAIESNLHKEDFNLILCDSEDSVEQEKIHLDILLRKGVDGLIFSPVDSSESYDILSTNSLPTVQIDRRTYKFQSDYVGVDNVTSAETATRHLFEHGREHIGFIGYHQQVYTMEKRLEGYRNVVTQHGTFDENLVKTLLYHEPEPQKDLASWLTHCSTLDALICANDDICYETLGALDLVGLRIPEDIALISFDDPKWFKYLKTPITTVRQPTDEVGRLAVERLMDCIQQKSPRDFSDTLLEADLIIRESCGSHASKARG